MVNGIADRYGHNFHNFRADTPAQAVRVRIARASMKQQGRSKYRTAVQD
jgi:hypothetical protein